MMQPSEETRSFQRVLDILEGALAPSVFLLPAVDRRGSPLPWTDRSVTRGRLGPRASGRRHPALEERLLDVGAPPVRIRSRRSGACCRRRPEPPLDHDVPEPVRQHELHQATRRTIRPRELGLPDAAQRSRPPREPPSAGPSGSRCCSLSWRNVVSLTSANRSNAPHPGTRTRASPSRTAVAIPSSGTPAASRLCTHRALSTSPCEKVSSSNGPQDPELDQPVDVAGIHPGPPGHLLARAPDHGHRA